MFWLGGLFKLRVMLTCRPFYSFLCYNCRKMVLEDFEDLAVVNFIYIYWLFYRTNFLNSFAKRSINWLALSTPCAIPLYTSNLKANEVKAMTRLKRIDFSSVFSIYWFVYLANFLKIFNMRFSNTLTLNTTTLSSLEFLAWEQTWKTWKGKSIFEISKIDSKKCVYSEVETFPS